MLKAYKYRRPHVGIRKFEDGGVVESEQPVVEVKPEVAEVVKPEESDDPIEDTDEVEAPPEKGLFSKIADFLLGSGVPKSVKNFLKSKGDKKIVNIEIGRVPVQKTIGVLVNLITNGKYNKVKNKLGYDNWFHLFMIITLDDGSKHKLEKNQTIKISNYSKSNNEENIKVSKIPDDLTLNSMFNKAYERYGEKRINEYYALSWNCQRFLIDLLAASKLLTIPLKRFILQDAGVLGKEISNDGKTKIKKITDIGNYVDRILQNISGGILRLNRGGVVQGEESEKLPTIDEIREENYKKAKDILLKKNINKNRIL